MSDAPKPDPSAGGGLPLFDGMKYSSSAMIERRRRILHEARRLINEVGFEGFSIRELSRRARVAPKTLYNAFGDRDRLIGLAIREVYDDIRRNIRFKTADCTLSGLIDRALVLNRGNLNARNYARAVASIYFAPATAHDLWAGLQEMAVGNTSLWLHDVRARGELQDWVEIEAVTRNMANMEYGLILDWSSGRVRDEDYLKRFAEIILLVAIAVSRGEQNREAQILMQRLHSEDIGSLFEIPRISAA